MTSINTATDSAPSFDSIKKFSFSKPKLFADLVETDPPEIKNTNMQCSNDCKPVSIKKMNYEKFRVESFRHWPVPYVNVRELAKSGFYYIGFDDIVECCFCGIRIRAWEAEDTPESEHQRWSPYCPFLENKFCNNVPLKNGKFDC